MKPELTLHVFLALCCTNVAIGTELPYPPPELPAVWQRVQIPQLGTIDIPPTMEGQGGSYARVSQALGRSLLNIDVGDSERVVIQQKGLNAFDPSARQSYVRVILETDLGNAGDFEFLTTRFDATADELAEISTLFRTQAENEFTKILQWDAPSLELVSGMRAIRLSYRRQFKNNPPVRVALYIFQNDDRMHRLTMSYRESERAKWLGDFPAILSSFRITNVRNPPVATTSNSTKSNLASSWVTSERFRLAVQFPAEVIFNEANSSGRKVAAYKCWHEQGQKLYMVSISEEPKLSAEGEAGGQRLREVLEAIARSRLLGQGNQVKLVSLRFSQTLGRPTVDYTYTTIGWDATMPHTKSYHHTYGCYANGFFYSVTVLGLDSMANVSKAIAKFAPNVHFVDRVGEPVDTSMVPSTSSPTKTLPPPAPDSVITIDTEAMKEISDVFSTSSTSYRPESNSSRYLPIIVAAIMFILIKGVFGMFRKRAGVPGS